MRHISEITLEEVIEMQRMCKSKAIEAMVIFATANDFSGLSHGGWFSFYTALDDAIDNAIESEVMKTKTLPAYNDTD